MGTKTIKLLIAIGLLSTSAASLGDAQPGENYVSIMGTYTMSDVGRNADDEFNGGQVSFGYAWKHLNAEIVFMHANLDSLLDESISGIGADLQWVFRRDARFTPYIYGGLGHLDWDPDNTRGNDGSMRSLGAGFYLDVGSRGTALRLDWRHRLDEVSPIDADDNLISLGIQIPFGGRKQAAPVVAVVDSDGDGVNDDLDRCPGTPAGTRVDSKGCKLFIDSDGDGVADESDDCANTHRNAVVDARGCELDSDNDGVVDRLDQCPDTAANVQVDVKGCEIKQEIQLPGVNFESNSDRLVVGAERNLVDAAATLVKNPTIHVEVAGHTDSDGAADYNAGLSARRAQTVYDYLAANGVEPDRMTVRGYGESQPIAENNTAAGKAMNRRVVLRITSR